LLLADDSVTIQRVIELTFAEEDVQVVAVSDGDQAIERLESAPPDIVLADIGMPGRNGYEVARYVRQTPKLAHIPVVLLTGAFEPVDQASDRGGLRWRAGEAVRATARDRPGQGIARSRCEGRRR
jgi:CheY-like chemotaxis protein